MSETAPDTRGDSWSRLLRWMTRARRVPVVRQLAATECGLACLASVLQLHGRFVTTGQLRERLEAGRDGLTADALLRAAQTFGLVGHGVALDVHQIPDLPRGSILHWSFSHFIVFDRVTANGIEVMDPALGRRRLSFDEVGREFTGVAVILEPGTHFTAQDSRRRPVPPLLLNLLLDRELLPHIVAASMTAQLLTLLPAFLTRTVIDQAIPLGSQWMLAVVALGAALCIGYAFWVHFVRALMMVHLRNRVDSRLSYVFLTHLLSLPFEFFQQRTAGDLTLRLSSGSAIRELLSSAVLSFCLDGSLVIGYLAVLLWVAPEFAVVALVIAAAQILVAMLSSQRRADLSAALLQASIRTGSYQLEVVTGIESVKAAGLERLAAQQWVGRLNSELNVSLEKGLFDAKVEAIGTTLRAATPMTILVVGAVAVMNGSLSLGEMLAYSAICNALLMPTSSLLSNIGRFSLIATHVERLNDVFESKTEDSDQRLKTATITGAVDLDRVSFRYNPDAPWVLKGVTSRILPGQLVGVVGRSGSGKSTLVRVLATLYAPSEGTLRFDGIDSRTLVPSALRRQLGVVTQSTSLFGLTIRDNITDADASISDEDVVRAARLACIHDDIMRMPMGYHTLLIDRGGSLSGGQRQRLAIARAVLRRPKILILDEATSHLDSVTEQAVTRQLRELDCTIIVVAHRLSTVIDADRLIVLESGSVLDEADHHTLLTRCPAYAALVAAQVGSSEPPASLTHARP